MKKNLLLCDNTEGYITAMGTSHTPSEQKLFIDSSKKSLKCVALLNENNLPQYQFDVYYKWTKQTKT